MMKLSIKTFSNSIMILSKKGLYVTLSIKETVVMLSVIMQNVIMLSVVMLSVVAPRVVFFYC